MPADDISMILMAENGLDLYGNSILVNTDFAAQNPDAVKSFLKALAKGFADAVADPEAGAEAVLKRNDVVQSFDGEKADTVFQFLEDKAPGETVKVVFKRGEEEQEAEVTLIAPTTMRPAVRFMKDAAKQAAYEAVSKRRIGTLHPSRFAAAGAGCGRRLST